ncbi:MAG: low molecular weight phosphotyrosine protein phosphatase [Bacteroidia bacterium]|nr:low molecular weight phosphotyrosine protein phosphatase [Bacteroidia bacterium]
MKILMVCLGNICRSPMAEGVMRTKVLHKGLAIELDSAGTSNYHTGEHPDERATSCAAKHNVDISHLRARQFSLKDFDLFDRIFVMDSSNYSDVIAMARNEDDRRKVELIMNVMYPDTNLSVPDPYYGGEEGFDKVFMMLESVCELIAASYKAQQ